MTTEEKLKEMLGDYYEMGVPGSPNAAILQNMLGADNELRDPQSENEALLKLIYEDVIGAVYDARDEAQAAAEAAGDAAEAVANKADAIVNTASGPIASFPDGADGMPLKSLVINIDPVQDLHGYDNPWPAGGGKNKLSYPYFFTTDTKNGCTLTVAADGTISFSGTPSADSTWNLKRRLNTTGGGSLFLPEGEYILNGCPSGGNVNTYQMSIISADGSPLGADRGEGVTFTIPSGGMNIGVQIFIKGSYNPNSLKIQPMIRLSSVSDATFAPYSNLCPISGHTGADVVRTGKNLFDKTATDTNNGYKADYYVGSDGVVVGGPNHNLSEYIEIKGGAQYTLSPLTGYGTAIAFYDASKQFISGVSYGGSTSKTVTTPSNAAYTRVSIPKANIDTLQLEAGSSVTTYEPYITPATITRTYTDSLGNQLTVYGGVDDVTGGVLRVTKVSATHKLSEYSQLSDGATQTHFRYLDNYFGTPIPKDETAGNLCNLAPAKYNNNDTTHFYLNTTNGLVEIWVPIGTPTTTDVQIVAEIKEPIEYTLTPADLSTLYGSNNIWNTAGDTVCEYRADTKLYINKILGSSEADMVADTNIESGKYFFIGGQLYLSTAAIAAGSTIIPGTNCTATNVAEALNTINA